MVRRERNRGYPSHLPPVLYEVSEMKLRIIAAVGGVVALLYVSWVLNFFSTVVYVEKVTGVEFPRGAKVLAEYDNSENYLIFVMRVPEKKAADFLARNRFSKPGDGFGVEGFLESLPTEYQKLPARENRYVMEGRSQVNTWSFIFEPSSSHLWCLVRYQDMAGDPP